MAKLSVIEQQYEWRGRFRLTAEPGDALEAAGLTHVDIVLRDAMPTPGVVSDDLSRVAEVHVPGTRYPHGFKVDPPTVKSESEFMVEDALEKFLAQLVTSPRSLE